MSQNTGLFVPLPAIEAFGRHMQLTWLCPCRAYVLCRSAHTHTHTFYVCVYSKQRVVTMVAARRVRLVACQACFLSASRTLLQLPFSASFVVVTLC